MNNSDRKTSDLNRQAPPHSAEAEKAVLGSILRNPEGFHLVSDYLREEQFFLDAHRRIYKAMSDLGQENEATDILTVADRLRTTAGSQDAIGPAYLVELTENCPVTQNIEHYARIVHRYYYLRRIIFACQDTIQGAIACEGPVASFIEGVEKEFLSIASEHDRKGLVPVNFVVEATLEQIQKNIERGGTLTGIPTGFFELDELNGGWQRSDLVILAARPGMGKTALALNIAAHAVKSDFKVGFFTLEMSKEQLMSRILASEARIDSSKIRRGEIAGAEIDRLMEVSRKFFSFENRFSIDETPGITLMELRSRCRRYQKEFGLDMIVIDYLQLMSGGHSRGESNREREISEISRGLKALAKELNMPVIALAQLNRSTESRPDKRPKISDLRESGSMEQDADMVLFVYRDEYYNPTSEKTGIAELIVGKNRHGSMKSIELAYQPNFVTFQNLMKV